MKTPQNRLSSLPLLLVALVLIQGPCFAVTDDQKLVEQARECIDKSQFTRALYYIDCAQKLNSGNRTIYYNRGRIFNKLEKYEDALEQFTKAIKIEPRYNSAIKKRGVVYIELKQYKNALADFTQALKNQPNDPETYSAMTRAYCDLGENKLALNNADQLIKLAPDRASYVVRARIKMNLKDFKGAIDDLAHVAGDNKRDDEAYLLKAQCHESLGDFKSALADYSRIIAFNKKDEMAFQKRGDVYMKLGETDKAIADYTSAIEFAPEANASLYRARANAYRKANKIDLAKKDEANSAKISGE